MPARTTPRLGRWIARVTATLLAGSTCFVAAGTTTAIGQDQCPQAGAAPSAQTLDVASRAAVCLVNAERARQGLRRLRVDRALTQAAERHSRHMVRSAFFSHVSPNGAGPSERLRRSGYILRNRAWRVGEALAWGTGTSATPTAIVAAWMASPPHRRILLGRGFREVGVGVAAGAPHRASGATYTLASGAIGG